MKRILNFGSLNIDEVYTVDHFVRPGETVLSRKVEQFPGGKGLNQSVAASRAGGTVWHAGCIGQDGDFLCRTLEEAGVSTELIHKTEGFSGKAVIQVESSGENCILLYQGANHQLSLEFISQVLSHFGEGDLLILQNEVNLLPEIIRLGKERGMSIALNPSPMTEEILSCGLELLDFLIINELEGEALSGESEPDRILEVLTQRYPACRVILTLGKEGACYAGPEGRFTQPIFPVKAVDTTAAGDTFAGYFFTCFSSGFPVPHCLELAAKASALAVSRMGASVSIPLREEVEAWQLD